MSITDPITHENCRCGDPHCFAYPLPKEDVLEVSYYGGDRTQEFIETFDLNFALGNVIKYVVRAGRKTSDPRDDLEKARWYLEREIARNGR